MIAALQARVASLERVDAPAWIGPGGIKISYVSPPSDSATAVQVRKADGTTVVLNIDTTNGDVYTAKGTWTPTWTGLTVTGSPIYTGTYRKIGSILYWSVVVNPNGGTTASTGGSGTYINNLPFAPSNNGTGIWTNTANGGSGGTCSVWVNHTNIYVPAWSASGGWWFGNGWVEL